MLFRPPAASRLASSLPISSGSRLYQSLMHCAARARACRAGGGAKQGPGMCSPGAGSEMAATAVARARRADARNPAARACGGPLRRRAGAAAACRRRATRTAQTSGRRQSSTQSCCAMRTASAPGVWSPCGSPPAGVRCAEQRGERALYQRPVKVAADVKPVPHRLPDLHRRCHKGFTAKYCCDRTKLPARRMAFQKVCSVANAPYPACLGSRAICWFPCCLNNTWTKQPH